MIPLRDTITSRTLPVVTTALIAINLFIFLQTPDHTPSVYRLYGLVPAHYTSFETLDYFGPFHQVTALFTFIFLHGGWMHLMGNMLTLYIFGDNVEDRLGHLTYLLFYLSGGIISGVTHLLMNPISTTPVIGASGAVAAVMGAYSLLYPRARILTLVPLFFIPLFFEIPAFLFLGLWFLMQFFNATGEISSPIAWWAHIGGFLFGVGFVLATGARTPPDHPQRFRIMRTHSRRLQIIHIHSTKEGFDLTGKVIITEREAKEGAVKRLTLFRFGRGRTITLTVPPGTRIGSRLRLRSLGLHHPRDGRGDLYLTITTD